ncbi:MAG: GAF domain-containing protein [Syntrophobacteraceae bacterium]|jgi:PAS domain S-box-containing protein
MKIQSKILVSIVSSVAVAAVIALIAFSILQGMNAEFARGRMYDEIINKTNAVNVLVASLKEGSGQSDVRQVKETLVSLDDLLKKMTSLVPREEALIRQLQKNNEELGPVIDQMLVSGQGVASDMERERRHILASQIWMKVRFISDDTNRLDEISQSRIISAREKAGAVVIALIVILALTNWTIYFLSGRSIVRAQEALRESEERYRVTLSSIGDAVIAADASGLVTFLNPAAVTLTGRQSPEAVGQPIQSVLKIIDERTRRPAENIVKRVLREGHIVNLANHTALVTRDGREIPIEDSAAPMKDSAGNVIGVVLVFHDVTEERRAREQIETISRFPDENPNPILRVSDDGRLLYANRNSAALLRSLNWEPGATLPEDWRQHAIQTLESGSSIEMEATCGEVVYSLMMVPLNDLGYLNIYGHDITARKRMEVERETTVEFLRLVNQSTGKNDLVRAAAAFFQRQSGCEAVGIRLKEGDDYPYYEASGFPERFVLLENSLCARDAAGNIIRDSAGDPYIECMCGNVICGRVDPSKPFFSPDGSFWANSTTRLLAATSDADRQTRTRNRCNGEGYESVALIPLRLGAERLGLLQLNDRRPGMFSAETIALWERLGGYLSVALARSAADEKVRHQNAILETINLIFYKALTCETEEQLGQACVTAAETLTQSNMGFIGEIGADGMLHDIAISDPGWELCAMYDKSGHRRAPGDFMIHGLYGRVLKDGKSLLTDDPYSHPDSIGTPEGHPVLTAFLGVPLKQDGKTIGMVGLGNREGGYTFEHRQAVEAIVPAMVQALMRNRAERTLNQSQSRFKVLSETASQLLASENPQALVNGLCREVMEHLDCHAFFNFLVDEVAGKLHLNACAGIPVEQAREIEWLDYGVAVCGCVARDGERIVAEDIFNTPDIRTDLVKSFGIQAYACHPLMVQCQLIGTLSFGTKTRKHFSPEDLALMKTVADQVAVAMERIRLIDELRRSRDELELRVQERTAKLADANEILRTEIVERKRVEAQLQHYMSRLEESNRALHDFAFIASHDLQEPLRKVKTFGGMLKQKWGGSLGEQGNDYLGRMLAATQRMQSLLAALLEYSRLATKADPFVEVGLTGIVAEVLCDLEVRIERTGAEVRVAELPVINADPTQMRQLFQNLIGNALKFHRQGEKPVIKVWSAVIDNSELQIVVEDNGIGFEEQYLDRIFAPFQRLHGKSGPYEGTGMGLAICKKIVERHGGSITAKSTVGVGTSFIVQLPLRQSQRV